ncbi:hypothetical protein ISS40_01385 [Candidatus Bathyarchaeota archaeon]|nr:hypothetical protein [Candidatus Bathyarchaeota archaeon]
MLTPFLMSLIAGSASGIGGLVVYLFGEVEDRVLGFLMGFAGGVMLIVSFLELFVKSMTLVSNVDATIAFTVRALIMMAIDLSPPHGIRPVGDGDRESPDAEDGAHRSHRHLNPQLPGGARR